MIFVITGLYGDDVRIDDLEIEAVILGQLEHGLDVACDGVDKDGAFRDEDGYVIILYFHGSEVVPVGARLTVLAEQARSLYDYHGPVASVGAYAPQYVETGPPGQQRIGNLHIDGVERGDRITQVAVLFHERDELFVLKHLGNGGMTSDHLRDVVSGQDGAVDPDGRAAVLTAPYHQRLVVVRYGGGP